MPKKIIWSPLAENDFSRILDYLNVNWDKKVALHFVELVNTSIEQLLVNPKQFPVINKREKVRKCVITKHNTLYYRNNTHQIDILRIYDSRQDPDKLLLE